MQNLYAIDRFVGSSAWTQRTRRQILQAANRHEPSLVSGQTGTGKQLIARCIHAHSTRSQLPFIPVNCAAMGSTLLNSQLFGSDTSASFHNSIGCFRAGHGGTIFLEEVGHLNFEAQKRVVDVIESGTVLPIGSNKPMKVDVRVIASTSDDLEQSVRDGNFRLDLLYHLKQREIETQPLRSRVADIADIVRHHVAKTTFERGLPLCQVSAAAIALLETHDWPGNVDQLKRWLEPAIETTATSGRPIGPSDFATFVQSVITANEPAAPSQQTANDQQTWSTLAELESQHIRRTLREALYNVKATARLLGLEEQALTAKLKQHRILLPVGAARTQCANL